MDKKGFTIIEVILAIFILTTAAFGSFNLIQQVIIAGSLNQSRLTAYYFAQQEIENIKNIRDTNYVQGHNWDVGINNSSLTVINFLDNTSSKFSRQINVAPATDSSGNNYLDIKVIVEWSERGRNHSVEVVNHLYDWFDDYSAPLPSCGENVTFTYKGSNVTYGTVVSGNNKCWMDRNLGASQIAANAADNLAYGDLFQWGRLDDRHQIRTSGITALEDTSDSDNPGHSNFIRTNVSPHDWRIPQNDNLWQGVGGINNPCPSGWRLPTVTEWVHETDSWSEYSLVGAFNSPLKLTAAGHRHRLDGSLSNVGTRGYYWSGTVAVLSSWNYAHFLDIRSDFVTENYDPRAYGYSVRCIKN